MNATAPQQATYPDTGDFLTAVKTGLGRRNKQIAPKFFYDERGSQLFDAICRQPEYYLPHAEREILTRHAADIAAIMGCGAVLIEPGAGSAEKVRLLLNELQPSAYVPLDISGDHLLQAARRLAEEYPWLAIHASCIDFCHTLELPGDVPNGRRVAFFPGSSLGNFEPPAAVRFLRRIRDAVGTDGGLLIGIDTKKDHRTLNAAYNDRAGITARFNLNLLERIRRELGAQVEPAQFEHLAYYNDVLGRIEMHLVSRERQSIELDGARFRLAAGERIHTECSYKYHPREFHHLAQKAGFRADKVWFDDRSLFSVHYLTSV